MKELIIERDVVFCEKPSFPQNMLVELTNICNHNCIFCGYGEMKRKKCICDTEFTKDIIRQAYENGTREIGFYLIGEPFLNPNLEEFVKYSHDLGFEYIYLDTNGALADTDRVKKLIENGLDSIKISINAATRETYKLIHGKDDFETVLFNLKSLHELLVRKQYNLKVFVSFIENNINRGEIEELHSIFDKLVDKVYVFSIWNQGGHSNKLVELGVVDSVNDIEPQPIPCSMVFNRLHVTAEGFLDACCGDCEGLLAVVDLHEKSLLEAWNDDIFINLRRRHLQRRFEGTLCQNCLFKTNEEVFPINTNLYSNDRK